MTTATAETVAATQVEFANMLGVHKSHITRLKQNGRLVLLEDGRVDVEASKLLIAETEGGREDVAARHAADKGKQAPVVNEKRVGAQTRKDMAQADLAEMERDKMRGLLIERAEVDRALADLVAFARQGVENLPHRVAPQLVGKDFDQIMAMMKQEVGVMMGDMHKEASKRLAELTKVEG